MNITEIGRVLKAAAERHKRSLHEAKSAYERWGELSREENKARDMMLDLFTMADEWVTTGKKPDLWDAFANDLLKRTETER